MERKRDQPKRRKRLEDRCPHNVQSEDRNTIEDPEVVGSHEALELFILPCSIRYKNAEVKMMEIMKEKEAVHGKPVLRPVLRLEARKHIGDTGLLDHLLKHVAGKVAPNGEDRFQRRQNAYGAMVYWLESAELVDLRKQAGVNDPFWIPPPGWKPSDSLTEEPTSAREIKLLQEEISMIRRDMQELITWKRSEDNGDKAIVPFTKSISENENSFLDNRGGLVSTMKDYENLLKRRAELEQQLSHVSGTIEKLKEDRNKKKGSSDMAEEREESVSLARQGTIESDKMTVDEDGVKGREEEESRAASKAAMRERSNPLIKLYMYFVAATCSARVYLTQSKYVWRSLCTVD